MAAPDRDVFTEGFAALVGIELVEASETEARARVAVRDELKQPAGLVDGGVYATVAENLCSMATYRAVRDARVLGMSNHTSLLRPITDGHLNALARARHRGRTTWVWEVDFTDDAGRLCALSRMTVAVRER